MVGGDVRWYKRNDRERLMQPATSHGRSSHGGHSYHAPGSSGNGLSYNPPAGAVPNTGLGGHILTQGGVGQSLGARYRNDSNSGQNDGSGRTGVNSGVSGGPSQSGVSLSVTALRYKDRGERSERDKMDSSTYGARGVSTTNSNSQFGGPFNQSAYGRNSQGGAAAAQAQASSMRSQQGQAQQSAQQQAQQQAQQAAAAQNRYATNPLAAPQGGGARWTGLSGLSLRGAAAR